MLVLLVGFVACHRSMGGPTPGAENSQAAVEQFLFAAKAQDLQAMSAVWGNEESLVRDREDRQQFERRLLILTCHLRHDQSKIGPAQVGPNGRQLHRVELTQGDKTASPMFTTVRNAKNGRWFVEVFELEPLAPFCKGGMAPPVR